MDALPFSHHSFNDPGGGGLTPPSLGGTLANQWKADIYDGVLTNGDRAGYITAGTEWEDTQSAAEFENATESLCPNYRTSEIGTMSALEFSGEYLTLNPTIDLAAKGSFTLAFVIKHLSAGGSTRAILDDTGSGGTNFRVFHYTSNLLRCLPATGSFADFTLTHNTTPKSIILRFNAVTPPTAVTCTARADGVNLTGSPSLNMTGSVLWDIGNASDGVFMGEFLIYDKNVSDVEAAEIETYFKSRYAALP